jgi:2-methylcitrate dehydratase PrpD
MSGQVGFPGLGGSNGPLLAHLAKLLARPVAASDRARAARHVLDWLGVAALGARSARCRPFVDLMNNSPQRGLFDTLALNAAAGNVLEMDDLHRTSILHPGPVIVPAALAVAEALDATGSALLDAIVRGYEATIRIGRALGASHYRFFHNTSTAGSFGAAAAAASLLKLNAATTAHALANAGSRTGGLWQMRHEPCETKSLHNAEAAQTGVQAAWLACHGARGPLTLLEGAQGLFAATAAESNPADVLNQADEGWLIHAVSFKPWPACRHVHPAIDAALALRDAVGATRIEAVELITYQSAIDFCDCVHPTTELQAKFSLQHAVAVSLIDGAPWLPAFEQAAWVRSDVAALRDHIAVTPAEDLSARFPQHYSASLRISLADGRVLQHEQRDALGDPECALSETALIEKAVKLLAAAAWPQPARIARAALALPRTRRVADFTALWGTR